VQALVRWDPGWHAAAELAARTEVGFPPAVRMAAVEGAAAAVAEVLDAVLAGAPGGVPGGVPGGALDDAPAGALDVEVLGPVELDPGPGAVRDDPPRERALLRVPRSQGRALAAALAAAQAVRSARKATEPVRVRLDPPEIG
jgi:primosomal protein N' (replication factor Y)